MPAVHLVLATAPHVSSLLSGMEAEDVGAEVAAGVADGVAEGLELQTPKAGWQPAAQKGAPVPQ